MSKTGTANEEPTMNATTATYSVTTNGLADLALTVELDAALTAALDGDNHHLIAEAIDTAINENLAEHGISADGEWLGDWSARDIVTAILNVADELDVIEQSINEDTTAATTLTLQHNLSEGADHDHGTEQGTMLRLTADDTIPAVIDRGYLLPAAVDDDGAAYWRAFRAADCYVEAWLALHGIDPTATDTFGTGWTVTFPRAAWH